MSSIPCTKLVTAALIATASLPAGAGVGDLFKATEPEVIYLGSTTSSREGVIVIRDPETFREAVAPLTPDYGGELPDLRKQTVLRIVGPELGTGCGRVELSEISTRMSRATVLLSVARPEEGCRCETAPRPRQAWLVSVGGAVRRASLETETIELACSDAQRATGSAEPTLILEGSWDGNPGAIIAGDSVRYAEIARGLGVEGRAPEVDLDSFHVVAVTGRPLANGCRRTLALSAELASPEEFVVTLEEVYPAPGQVCTQVLGLPRVFVYRVPATVTLARVVTRESR